MSPIESLIFQYPKHTSLLRCGTGEESRTGAGGSAGGPDPVGDLERSLGTLGTSLGAQADAARKSSVQDHAKCIQTTSVYRIP